MRTYTFHVSIPDAGQAWRKVELTGEQTLQDLHVAIQESLEWEPDDDIAFFMGDDPLGDGQQYVIFDIADEDEDEDDWEEDDLLDDEIEALVDTLPPLDIGDKPRPQSMEEMLDLLDSDPEVRAQVGQMLTDQLGVPSFLVNMVLSNAKSLLSMVPEGMLSAMTGPGPEPLDAAETSLESLDLEPGRTFIYMFGQDDWRFDVRVEAIDAEADADAVYPRLLQASGPAPEQYVDEDDWLWGEIDDEDDEDDEDNEDDFAEEA